MQQGVISPDLTIKSTTGRNTVISGYASVFAIADLHNDVIIKGTFKKVREQKIKLLWQHDFNKPIGVVTNLSEDDYGLKIEAEINNRTKAGFEATELIKQGAVEGLSIGFSINSSEYGNKGERIINDADLMEISVVTFPANKSAVIHQVKGNNLSNLHISRLEYLSSQLKNY